MTVLEILLPLVAVVLLTLPLIKVFTVPLFYAY